MLDVGFFEIVALAVVALVVFGPDKLPSMAADAARLLRQLRQMAQGARDEVTGALGPEFSDLNLNDLDPRAFLKRQLLEETDDLDKVLRDEPGGAASAKKPAAPGAVGDADASPAALRDDGDAT